MASIILYSFGAVCCTVLLVVLKKSGHFFRALFFSALQGSAALLAVNAVGNLIAVSLPINILTFLSGVFFGTPGIIMHLICLAFLK